MTRLAIPASALLAVSLYVSGCGSGLPAKLPVVPAQGKIAAPDVDLTGMSLTLIPADSKSPSPWSTVESGGNFKISTYSAGDGAPVGTYVVVINEPQLDTTSMKADPRTKKIPKQYRSAESSPLKLEVAADSSKNNYDFKVGP